MGVPSIDHVMFMPVFDYSLQLNVFSYCFFYFNAADIFLVESGEEEAWASFTV